MHISQGDVHRIARAAAEAAMEAVKGELYKLLSKEISKDTLHLRRAMVKIANALQAAPGRMLSKTELRNNSVKNSNPFFQPALNRLIAAGDVTERLERTRNGSHDGRARANLTLVETRNVNNLYALARLDHEIATQAAIEEAAERIEP